MTESSHLSSSLVGKFCETAFLAIVGILIVVFCSLPIMFHFIKILKPSSLESSVSISINCSSYSWESVSSTCTAVPYTGSVCRDILSTWQQCALGQDDTVWVSDTGNMMATETLIFNSINKTGAIDLQTLTFFCLYFFPLCNGTNPKTLTRDECNVIMNWFKFSKEFEFNCTNLSNAPTNNYLNTAIVCREGFTLINGSCHPICHIWEQNSHLVTVILNTFIVFSSTVGLFAGICVIIISFIRHSNMLKFPSVAIVYINSGFCFIVAFELIGETDKQSFYCSSLDLMESLNMPTLFCTLSGAVIHYFQLFISFWWLIHIIFLFLKVMWPFLAQSSEKKLKIVHIILLIVISVVPMPAVCAVLISDELSYGFHTFPPSVCVPSEVIYFYSLTLVVNVIGCTGIILLFLVLWRVHKMQGLFKLKRKVLITSAEKKLVIVLLYFAVFFVIDIVNFVLIYITSEQLESNILQHFSCESHGYIQGQCNRDSFENSGLSWSITLSRVIFGFLPVICLVFVIDIQDLTTIFLIGCCYRGSRRALRRSKVSQTTLRIACKNTMLGIEIQNLSMSS